MSSFCSFGSFGSYQKPVADEPDFEKGYHFGLAYRIIRHPRMGHLCGYVRLPKGHPWLKEAKRGRYGMKGWGINQRYGFIPHGYDAHVLRYIAVHSGLTWSGHLPTRRGEKGYWLGFDCAHYDDFVPAMGDMECMKDATYRDMAYVRAECAVLAFQIRNANAATNNQLV